MTDEEKEMAVLNYLSNVADDLERYRSLTTIFEHFTEPRDLRDSFFDHVYPHDDQKEALRNFLDHMVVDGLVETREDENAYEQAYRITDQGIYEISFGDAPLVVEEKDLRDRIDSSRWTGIEQRVESDPSILEAVKLHVRSIDDLVEKSGLTNTERAKAKAISVALVSLVESPQPEWRAIVELLTSPNLTAVLNVAQILGIIFTLIGIGR